MILSAQYGRRCAPFPSAGQGFRFAPLSMPIFSCPLSIFLASSNLHSSDRTMPISVVRGALSKTESRGSEGTPDIANVALHSGSGSPCRSCCSIVSRGIGGSPKSVPAPGDRRLFITPLLSWRKLSNRSAGTRTGSEGTRSKEEREIYIFFSFKLYQLKTRGLCRSRNPEGT